MFDLENPDLVGASLCDFAAKKEDVNRLQEFLQSISSKAVQQALTLQCCFQTSGIGKNEAKPSTYEVTLFGVLLPPDAAFESSDSSQDSKKVFVGIKAGLISEPGAGGICPRARVPGSGSPGPGPRARTP